MKLVAALIALTVGVTALAESFTIRLAGEPQSATATVHVFEGGLLKTTQIDLVRVTAGMSEITVDKSVVNERPFFVSIVTADGSRVTSDVVSAGVLTSANACDEQPTSLHKPEEQLTLINGLVSIRERYHRDARERVKNLLSQQTIDDISRLERLLGLSAPTPISPEMEPLELARRLNRLVEAVRNYQASRNVTK